MSILDNIMHLFRGRRNGLTCEEVNHFLAAYLDGALDERTRTRFERHLNLCPNCGTYFDQYRATIQLVHDEGIAETAHPPDELVDCTLSFLRKEWQADESDSDGEAARSR